MTRKATNFDQKWTKSDQNLSKETKKDQNEQSLKKQDSGQFLQIVGEVFAK